LRAGRFAKGAHHHLTGAGAQPIRNDDNVSRWFFFEIVRMDHQKANAFKIRVFLVDQTVPTTFARTLFRVSSFEFRVGGYELFLTRNSEPETRKLLLSLGEDFPRSPMSRAAGVIMVSR